MIPKFWSKSRLSDIQTSSFLKLIEIQKIYLKLFKNNWPCAQYPYQKLYSPQCVKCQKDRCKRSSLYSPTNFRRVFRMRAAVVNTVIWPFISEITFAVQRDGYSTLVAGCICMCIGIVFDKQATRSAAASFEVRIYARNVLISDVFRLENDARIDFCISRRASLSGVTGCVIIGC